MNYKLLLLIYCIYTTDPNLGSVRFYIYIYIFINTFIQQGCIKWIKFEFVLNIILFLIILLYFTFYNIIYNLHYFILL